MIALCVLGRLNLIVWGGLTLLGLDGMQSVREQHIPGYPASGQIAYYVLAPALLTTAAIVIPLLGRSFKDPTGDIRGMGKFFLLMSLLLLLPYLLLYSGGV